MPEKNPLLTSLFNPKSIAIIGASQDTKKVGNILLRNIIESGFKGEVYPVNPKAETIENIKSYQNYDDIPQIPDLAIIAIPAEVVNQSIEQIAKRGTKNILVLSAGFKEMGGEGTQREEQMKQLAIQYNLNIIGPNCLGFVNNECPLNATFAQQSKKKGNLHFISQSGAIASSMFDWAEYTKVGFTDFITLGNKAVLSENEVLQYFLNESEKKSTFYPVGLYLESIQKGKELMEIAYEYSLHSPIFILKPGKSKAAQKAMKSHTGAIAGEDAVLDAALKQCGIIRCEGIEDLFDLARACAFTAPPLGPNVAIISNAGGPAVISSDIVVEEGLQLATIDEKTHNELLKHLPPAASVINPVDVLGDALADRYANAIDIILAEETVDILIVILTPQVMTQIKQTAEVICQLSSKHNKPILCSFMGGSLIDQSEQILNEYKIPSFRFPERAIKTVANMWKWKKWQLEQSTLKVNEIPTDLNEEEKIQKTKVLITSHSKEPLSGYDMQEIMNIWDIKSPATTIIHSIEEAQKFASTNNFPLVLKVNSPKILHKTEIGGVISNIQNGKELIEAYQQLHKNISSLDLEVQKTCSVQIQQFVKGIEVLVGIKKDPSFGNVLMVGAGGILTELILDRNLHILPITMSDIEKLTTQTKIFKLLNGYRGDSLYAVEKLNNLIFKFCTFVEKNSQFTEIEINPVIVTHDEAFAIDIRGILQEEVPLLENKTLDILNRLEQFSK